MSDTKYTFMIEEYRSLRAEIELLYRLSFDAERNAIGGLVVLYGFLFSARLSDLSFFEFSDVLWFLPVVLVVYARWRISQYYRGMSLLGDYISAKHEAVLIGDDGGWETHLRRRAALDNRSMLGFFKRGGAIAFWNLVVVLTIVTAIWQFAVGL